MYVDFFFLIWLGDQQSPEKEADDAQPVDAENHKIAGAPATDDAIK